ncbi:MAG: HEPN domain-containing protein [Candidatus Bathyarchaeia archaeon]
MTEPLPRLVEASLRRAERALRSARLLLDHGELDDAVSRAYCAMFHAARATLFKRAIVTKTHMGTISLFGEHLVKKGLLDEEYTDMLRRAFDLRQRSDYEP